MFKAQKWSDPCLEEKNRGRSALIPGARQWSDPGLEERVVTPVLRQKWSDPGVESIVSSGGGGCSKIARFAHNLAIDQLGVLMWIYSGMSFLAPAAHTWHGPCDMGDVINKHPLLSTAPTLF